MLEIKLSNTWTYPGFSGGLEFQNCNCWKREYLVLNGHGLPIFFKMFKTKQEKEPSKWFSCMKGGEWDASSMDQFLLKQFFHQSWSVAIIANPKYIGMFENSHILGLKLTTFKNI